MIRNLFISIAILFSLPAHTQNWFPDEATWYYNQVILGTGNTYRKFEVLGDTTVQGKYCKIVAGNCQCSSYPYISYLHQDVDRIYIYISDLDAFKVLYDFGLMPGDTVDTYGSDEGNGRYLIDSIGFFQAGTETLRVQHIHFLGPPHAFGSKIYERIGSNGCLYPVITYCDPSTGGLRCYQDNTTGLVNFQPSQLPCDYMTSGTGEVAPEQVNVFPNPVSGALTISADRPIAALEFTHMASGRVFRSAGYFQNQVEISVAHMPVGSYILKIRKEKSDVEMVKVMILE